MNYMASWFIFLIRCFGSSPKQKRLSLHFFKTFLFSQHSNSQGWPTCNFSQKYPYIIQVTGHENTQNYQVDFVILIYWQIVMTYLQTNCIATGGRFKNKIIGVKWSCWRPCSVKTTVLSKISLDTHIFRVFLVEFPYDNKHSHIT